MMNVIVFGRREPVASKLVINLLKHNITAILASPETGLNPVTGEGLSQVIRNADVVVDVTDFHSIDEKILMDFYQRSAMNLLNAGIYAKVKHHILLSAVGAEPLSPLALMRAKSKQEEIVIESGVPFTIVRSTPFFELAAKIANDATVGSRVYISSAPFQPVASVDVVSVLTDVVVSSASNSVIQIAGPAQVPVYEFIRYYLTSMEDSRQVVLDDDLYDHEPRQRCKSLLPVNKSRVGKLTYEEWFKGQLTDKW
jgi:dTDP-4-dehydrorhamnose reductase